MIQFVLQRRKQFILWNFPDTLTMLHQQTFSIADDRDAEVRRVMNAVYAALVEKGYNPINQIVGYLISEDPTYITNYKNARSLIRKVERDELLSCIIKYYLGI